MKRVTNLARFGMVLLVLPTVIGCCDSVTQCELPESVDNLLVNGSFERAGRPTLAGWTVFDWVEIEIVSSPAPGGGQYSLRLASEGHLPPSSVVTTVGEAPDGEIYRLSAFVRGSAGLEHGGRIMLSVGQGEQWTVKETSTYDTMWTQISVVDTIRAAPHDTLKVWLSALFAPGPSWGEGLFDRVVLERLDD